MMLRAQSRGTTSLLLQNDQANYSYHGGTVYINNHRMWLDDLSVLKLPTDSTETRGFLAQIEGIRNDIQPVSAKKGRGLLAVVERTKDQDQAAVDAPWTISSSNVLEADYFQQRLADECPDRGQSRCDASAGLDALPHSRQRRRTRRRPAPAGCPSSTR